MTQVEQKRSWNKLKHNLEPYRSLIVQVNSILSWEKSYHPGIVFGTISFTFLLLWAIDFSFITLISLGLLLIVVSDYILPTVTRLIGSSSNKWDGDHEAQFERVCDTLCSIQWTIRSWYEFMFKESKSTMFVIIISIGLLALAWLGAIVNNLLFMYIVILVLAMWPGLQHKHIFKSIIDQCSKAINNKIGGGSGDKKKGD